LKNRYYLQNPFLSKKNAYIEYLSFRLERTQHFRYESLYTSNRRFRIGSNSWGSRENIISWRFRFIYGIRGC